MLTLNFNYIQPYSIFLFQVVHFNTTLLRNFFNTILLPFLGLLDPTLASYYHLSFPDFFEFAKSIRTRANHYYKLYFRRAVCNCYKYSFFILIVRKWNHLPGYIVHAEPLSVLKSRLKFFLNIY